MRHVLFTIIALLLCSGAWIGTQAAESQAYNLSDGASTRTYLLYRPPFLSLQKPVPLVIVLHGGFGSGGQAESSYNWDAQAYRQGFVVAYPDGINHSWNAGGICCGSAMRDHVDDVDFLTRLIQTISHAENIDPKRVYLTGISNGAALAYRYACEGSYPIAAIGPVAGSLSFSCPRPHPVSVMEIHGMNDQNVPFAGGIGTKGVTKVSWLPVQETLDAFRAVDNCQPPTLQQNGPLQTTTSHCVQGREVALIAINGAGHQWPGGQPPKKGFIASMLRLDPPSKALDATGMIWGFFQNKQSQP